MKNLRDIIVEVAESHKYETICENTIIRMVNEIEEYMKSVTFRDCEIDYEWSKDGLVLIKGVSVEGLYIDLPYSLHLNE